ncbi:hypothetical protein RUM44_005224 [Polyplax serrata]|uniref:Uncharacterized protein n=1 Tax=Polyplax serrata TaxID=468196 RepID=A0ABR1AEV2_POLSC
MVSRVLPRTSERQSSKQGVRYFHMSCPGRFCMRSQTLYEPVKHVQKSTVTRIEAFKPEMEFHRWKVWKTSEQISKWVLNAFILFGHRLNKKNHRLEQKILEHTISHPWSNSGLQKWTHLEVNLGGRKSAFKCLHKTHHERRNTVECIFQVHFRVLFREEEEEEEKEDVNPMETSTLIFIEFSSEGSVFVVDIWWVVCQELTAVSAGTCSQYEKNQLGLFDRGKRYRGALTEDIKRFPVERNYIIIRKKLRKDHFLLRNQLDNHPTKYR